MARGRRFAAASAFGGQASGFKFQVSRKGVTSALDNGDLLQKLTAEWTYIENIVYSSA